MLVVGGVLGGVILIIDDLTGVGTVDDALLPADFAIIAKGAELVFG